MITDVEFKQWGMRIQIEQQQEIDIILHVLLVKLFAAVELHFFIHSNSTSGHLKTLRKKFYICSLKKQITVLFFNKSFQIKD